MLRSKIIRIVFIVAILLILFATPTFAITNPDSISIRDLTVFREIFSSGDWLITVHYEVNYTTEPTEPISDIYQLIIYDGATIIATRDLNYYGNNLISIWLSSSEVASKGLVWNTAYTAKIQSKPPNVLTSATRSFTGNYDTGASFVISRAHLADWIIERETFIESEESITLLTTVSTGTVLNSTGTTMAIDAIPGVLSILNIFQYGTGSVSITRDDKNREGEATLMGYMDISKSDNTTSWYGTSVNTTWDRVEGDAAIRDDVYWPVITNSYSTIYAPSSGLDFSNGGDFEYSIKSNLKTDNFTSARVYITDTTGAYRAWTINFTVGMWTRNSENFTVPDFTFGAYNPAITENITWTFIASEATPFYKIVDNVRMYHAHISGIGTQFRKTFEGIGDWMKLPWETVSFSFIIMIALVSSSIIYLRFGNPMASIGIAGVPIFLWAAYLGMIPLGWILIAAIIITVLFVWVVWLR